MTEAITLAKAWQGEHSAVVSLGCCFCVACQTATAVLKSKCFKVNGSFDSAQSVEFCKLLNLKMSLSGVYKKPYK